MEPKRPTFNTSFWLVGDRLEPDEFTRIIGIQPNKVTKKDEISSHPTLKVLGRKNSATSWTINFERQSNSMDKEVKRMIGILWDKRDCIREYVRDKSDVCVGLSSTPHIYECGVKVNGSEQTYDLSVDTVTKLADLGCKFWMDDIYDYRPPLPLPPQLEGWSDDNPFLTTSVWVGGEGFDLAEWKACMKELAVEPLDNGKGNPGNFSPEQGEVPAGPSWHLMRTSRSYSTDEAIQEVLAPLWSRREAIKAYFTQRPGVMGRVRCLVEIVEDRTVYELLLPTLQQLAFLGWAVRLDVHNYCQEDDDE